MRKHDQIPTESIDPVAALELTGGAADRVVIESEHNDRLATIGTLAAGVVHEINNILTPVLAFAQMAAAHPRDTDLQTKAIEKTIQGVELATRIADAILGFAGQNGDADADVAHVVRAALDCLARDPNKDQIKMRIDVQPGMVVHMNPLNLQQVLMNLILNAVAAMQGRGGRLTIAAISRADGTVGLRVSDTGPGIPKEIAGRIFEPFVTTKRSGEGSVTGTGLGLAICRRLVEQAGGSITASSKPGDGTTFLVILPSSKSRRAKAS